MEGHIRTMELIKDSEPSTGMSSLMFYLKKALETDGFDVDECHTENMSGCEIIRPKRHGFKRDKRVRNNCRLALQHLMMNHPDYKDAKFVLVSILKYNYQGFYLKKDYLTFTAKDLSTHHIHVFQALVSYWPVKKLPAAAVEFCRPLKKEQVVKDSPKVEGDDALHTTYYMKTRSGKVFGLGLKKEAVNDLPKVKGEVIKDSPKVEGEVLKDLPKKKGDDDSVHTYMKTRSGKAFRL